MGYDWLQQDADWLMTVADAIRLTTTLQGGGQDYLTELENR